MARTIIAETSISQSVPTPINLQAMDATSVATTLSGSVNGTTQSLPVSSQTNLNNGDYLLINGAERVLILGNVYTITITSTGTPDVFQWSLNGTVQATGVSITGSSQTLSNGVTIAFAATTGHTNGASWTITVNAGAIGSVVYSLSSGLNDATSGGTWSGNLYGQRGVSGTAATPQASGVAVVDLNYGNAVLAPSGRDFFVWFNSDTSVHTITVYGPSGSAQYTIQASGYLVLGRFTTNLANFIQPNGQLWFNTSSALVFMAAMAVN